VAFLNADEELLLIKLYITKITQLCGLFRFPEEVEATAVTYLKRFYLKNTVMDWHPKNVMCVYFLDLLSVSLSNFFVG
jgi:cyclin H